MVWTVNPKDGSESFGVQKARCEEIVRAAFGKGSIVVRPSYMAFDLKLLEERRGAP